MDVAFDVDENTLQRIQLAVREGKIKAPAAGEIPAEAGSIVVSPPSATLGYLPQEHERHPGESVLGALARRTGVAAAQAALDDATERLTAGEDGADDAYGEALERWLALGGADLDERAAEVVADPQFRARGMLVEHHDERFDEDVLGPGVVPTFSATPGAVRWAGPPVPGHHNAEVFGELGLSGDEIAALADEKTI